MTATIKQRHGCVTAWLIIMIIANSFIAFLYLFFGDFFVENLPGGISNTTLVILAILGIANVLFAVLLFTWMKIGFWGFLVSGLVAFAININAGLGVVQSLPGLFGIGLLYGVLQIKRNNVSTWSNLEPNKSNANSLFKTGSKSRKTLKKEQLEVEERKKMLALEESERLKRRQEKEDPNRFMPK